MALKVLCFNQEGCMGCEEQSPINQEVSVALGVEIEEIDAVKNTGMIQKYALRVTPTIIILVDEEEKKRYEGVVHREELENAIKNFL